MKIGTVTFHSANNYGAMLQAYALPQAIQSLGYDCQVVDYRSSAVTQGVEIDWPKQLIGQHGLIRGGIKSLNRWYRGWYAPTRKDVRFNRFMEKKLPLTDATFRCAEDINVGDFDTLVFGSDQIWNTQITKNDKVYFGRGIQTRKVAYAASSGTDSIPDEMIGSVAEFAALGIREKGLTTTLREKGLDAVTVVDPVLLLTKEQWRKVEAPLPKGLKPGGYILIYTFDEWPVYELARKISAEENLPMVIVRWCGYHDRFNDMIQLPNTSPEEFVSLIDNAAVVCTSSFHGTAFSVLFEKRFYCCTPGNFGSRTNSLLEQVDLLDCRVESGEINCKRPDYSVASEKLSALRQQSLDFLKNAIEAGEANA